MANNLIDPIPNSTYEISKAIRSSPFTKGMNKKYVLLCKDGSLEAFDTANEALVRGYSIFDVTDKLHVEYIVE